MKRTHWSQSPGPLLHVPHIRVFWIEIEIHVMFFIIIVIVNEKIGAPISIIRKMVWIIGYFQYDCTDNYRRFLMVRSSLDITSNIKQEQRLLLMLQIKFSRFTNNARLKFVEFRSYFNINAVMNGRKMYFSIENKWFIAWSFMQSLM